MPKKIIVLVLFCCGIGLMAQKQTKEFFNADWKQCDSAVASYYRLVTYDDKGTPVGMVRDYFISGEIQWEGRFSKLDKYDSYNSKHEGECTWFYKNGKKQTSSFYLDGVMSGSSTGWYENGTHAYSSTYRNGKLNGLYVAWFESGLLQSYAYYDNGKVVGPDAFNCDEFGECGATEKYDFFPPKGKTDYADLFNFSSIGSDYGYFTAEADEKDFTTTIESEKVKPTYKDQGLILTTSKEEGIKKLFKPLNYKKLLVITTKITHIKGDSKAKSGLVFAYTDDKNYHSFLIDKDGNYELGQFADGTYTELSKGTAYASNDDYYDYDYYEGNKSKSNAKKEQYFDLFVMSYKDTVQCFVGYTPVYKTPAFTGAGNFIG